MKNFLIMAAATVVFTSAYYMMMPVIPTHLLDLGYDNMTIGFVVFLFSFSSLFARPLGGILVDRWGSRRLMLFSAALFFLTPFLVKLPTGLIGIKAAQLLYGLTIGSFAVASTTFASEVSTPETITQFMGINSISFIVAKGISPAIGLKIMDFKGFNGTVTATIFAAVLAVFLVITSSDARKTEKVENKANFFEVLFNKNVLLPTFIFFCGMTSYGCISAMLPVFANDRSITGIEYFFLINTAVVVASRLLLGRWSKDHIEELIVLSLIMIAITLVLMSFVTNFWQLVLVALIYGFGFAMIHPMLTSMLVLHLNGISKAMALGIFTTGFDLGVAAGSIMGGLSKYISFQWLYLLLSLIPLTGFFVFQYVYRPGLSKKDLSQNAATF